MFRRLALWLRILTRLEGMDRKLDRIIIQGARAMTKIDDVNTLLTKIDEETNKVAAEIQQLKDQVINSGGISGADADAVVAKLGSLQSRLQALGADPDNPVPDVPPVEPGTPG